MYRVLHRVDDFLLLTLQWELCFSVRSFYCGGTFNLMLMNSVPRPDGPPCKSGFKVNRHWPVEKIIYLNDQLRSVQTSYERRYVLQKACEWKFLLVSLALSPSSNPQSQSPSRSSGGGCHLRKTISGSPLSNSILHQTSKCHCTYINSVHVIDLDIALQLCISLECFEFPLSVSLLL